MKIFESMPQASIEDHADIEAAVWCLIGLRARLKVRNRSFDDAIVNTCIELLYRELLSDYLVSKGRSAKMLDKVLFKNMEM